MTFPIEVIKSTRRKKTVSARLVEGTIEIRVPSRLSQAEIDEHTVSLVAKIERQVSSAAVDLDHLAKLLARRFAVPEPASIRWVSNQRQRWGSCTHDDAAIRISDRLTNVPRFVLEYVVLHELTHLLEPNHGPRFHELMARYPKAERAEGYLMALSRR